MHVIRVISGDNDLSALEFQKHYRLPIVHLLDPSRIFDSKHNPNGWPFLMLADQQGHIVYKKNGLVDTEQEIIQKLLDNMLQGPSETKPITCDGVAYMPATLERTGETKKLLRRERFSSLACGPAGEVYVAFTTNRNGNSDVFVRTFDGKNWSEDKPVAATVADEYDGTIIVDKQNQVWVSWTSNADGSNYNIFATTLANTAQPMQITHAADGAMHARMACDGNGNVYVTYYKWHKMGQWSRDKEIYLRRWSGSKWSGEVQISPTDVPQYEDHSDPAIAACDDAAIVCWSWDFHRPKGYTAEAHEPTIFMRRIDGSLNPDRITAISGGQIDMTPTVCVSRDKHIWCAWDSLGPDTETRGYRKTPCIKQVTSDGKETKTKSCRISGPVLNLCTPTLAASPTGAIALLWSETEDGRNWVLRRAEFDPKQNKWSKPKTVESEGNPRYCSADYDKAGQLWVSYSVQTGKGREVIARKLETGDL